MGATGSTITKLDVKVDWSNLTFFLLVVPFFGSAAWLCFVFREFAAADIRESILEKTLEEKKI